MPLPRPPLKTGTRRMSLSSTFFQDYWRREAVEVVGSQHQVDNVPPETAGGLTAHPLT